MKHVKNLKKRVSSVYIPESIISKPKEPIKENNVNYEIEHAQYLIDLEEYNKAFERWQEDQEYEQDDILEHDIRRKERIIKNKSK